jgi:hypothetical protein
VDSERTALHYEYIELIFPHGLIAVCTSVAEPGNHGCLYCMD